MKQLSQLESLVRRIAEAKDEQGNTIYTTYAAWKRAAAKCGAWIDGDEDIAQAMKGEKPYKKGKTMSIGEWDGSEGFIEKGCLKEDSLTEELKDSKGQVIKKGDTLIWYDVNGKHVSTVEADPKYNGGLRVGGRSVKNVIDDADKVTVVKEDTELEESADYAKQLVRGEKAGPGILNKLDRWLTNMMIEKDKNRFIPAEHALKQLRKAGFSEAQITMIRDAATSAANTAVETMHRKHGAEAVPRKYIAALPTSFGVFDLYLNVSPDIHEEFAALMRKLFDAKIDKIKDKLNIVKEDKDLQSLGKGLKKGKEEPAAEEPAADAAEEPEVEEPETTKPFDKEAAEKPEIKVGDVVKPLKGPHKDEPHLVIGISSDGQLEIKPKDIDDTANKYSKKKARIKPENVVLGEGLKYEDPKSVGRKVFNKVMGIPSGKYKYKVGDTVKYEMTPGQKNGSGTAVIKKLADGHHYILDNGAIVNQNEIKSVVSEAVAAPFKKFKKGQVVTVKKTGEKVEVLSQSDIGLVQTVKVGDGVPAFPKGKGSAVQAKGHKEYSELSEGLIAQVTEASKPNMKKVEDQLKAHAQSKIDYEKKYGPMSAGDLVSHENVRKRLLKDLSRERSKANVSEEIKGWKHAQSDLMKARSKASDAAKGVKLVALKKDGNESKMNDATKAFKDRAEAIKHHNNMVKFNPTKNICHNLYCDGKVEKLEGEQK